MTRLKKILKTILKLVLGLLAILVLLVVLIQLPPVQKYLTGKAENYLEEKSGGKVTINKVVISLSGNVVLEGIELCTPEGECNISLGMLIARLDPFALLNGNLEVGYLNLSRATMHLKLEENSTSLDYLINAFSLGTSDSITSDETPAPFTINADEVYVSNANFYLDIPNSLKLHAWIGEFSSSRVAVGLYPNFINIGEALLNKPGCDIILISNTEENSSASNDPLSIPDLPGYRFYSGFNFDVGSLQMQNGTFSLHENEVAQSSTFDPYHMSFQNINFQLSDVLMKKLDFSVDLQNLSLISHPFEIRDLDLTAQGTDTTLIVQNLVARTPESLAELHFQTSFTHIKSLLKELDQNETSFELSAEVNPNELAYFLTDSIGLVLPERIKLQAEAVGNTTQAHMRSVIQTSADSINVSGLFGNWFGSKINWEDLQVAGKVMTNTPFVEQFSGDFTLPNQFNIIAKSDGSLDSLHATLNTWSDWGASEISGSLWKKEDYLFDLAANSSQYNLSGLAGDGIGEEASMELEASGSYGDKIKLQSTGTFHHAKIYSVKLEDIIYQLDLNDNSLDIHIQSMDSLAQADAIVNILLQDTIQLGTRINLTESDLSQFYDLPSPVLMGFELNSLHQFSQDFSYISGGLDLQNASFYSKNDSIQFDSLKLTTDLRLSSAKVVLASDLASGSYESNFGLRETYDILSSYLNSLTSHDPVTGLEGKDVKMEFNMTRTDGLELFGYPIEGFDKLSLNAGISSEKQGIFAKLQVEEAAFQGFAAERIELNIKDPLDTAYGTLSVQKISYDSLDLASASLDLRGYSNQIDAEFSIYDSSKVFLNIRSRLTEAESWKLFIDSVGTYYGNLSVRQEKPISFEKDIIVPEISLQRGTQQLVFGKNADSLYARIQDYDLGDLTEFIKYDSMLLLDGELNATLNFNSRENQFEASTRITDLSLLGSKPVTIMGSAYRKGDMVPFKLEMKGVKNNGLLEGEFENTSQEITARLNSEISNLEILNPFLNRRVANLQGRITADIDITGKIDNPELTGYIALQDFDFQTTKPQLSLRVDDDRVLFDQKGIHFDNFTLFDSRNNKAIIDGYLNTTDYRDFFYDLSVKSDRFLIIDNPEVKDNQVQGQLYTGLDMKFKGGTENTLVNATITIDDSTDISYITPPEEIEIVSDQGIVQFVEPDEMFDTTYTVAAEASLYELLSANLPGFNLTSRLVIEDGAVMRVVVDPRSGDYLEFSSKADLYFAFDKNGEITIDGTFDIAKGRYELSFYNIVRKGFDITPGSTVSWSGNAENGELNIEAVHTVQASSVALIGHEIGENERTIYNRSLPYKIGINIQGTLMEPSVFFTLDLPPRERSNYPVLDSKLSRLAQPEFQGELNKQVFALLVLGGFLPETTGIDESTVASTALANSVNSILSGQLNKLTGEYIKGVDIDLGMSSYADFGSAGGGQTRTAVNVRVSKSLANDRLTIEAGGSFDVNSNLPGSNNFRGDVAIIYDLTESGNKQLKAFNNETYDIIYHEVRNTGLALIFIKEFDSRKKKDRDK